MKNALELMCEKIRTTDASFTLRSEDPTDLNCYSFMHMSVGKARLIYGFAVNTNDPVGMKDRAELIAVLANKTIYLYNYFFFPSEIWPTSHPLPEGVVIAADEVSRIFEILKTQKFQAFYNALDTSKLDDQSKNPWMLEDAARREALCGPAPLDDPNIEFDSDDLFTILCGTKTLDDFAGELFEEKVWLPVKARRELISALAKSYPIKSWEQTMYEALQSLDAKAVTVTFEKAGTQETEKIDPAKIAQMLVDNDDFSYWDFTVSKNGKQLMEKLCPKRERLICEDIVKITYGKKTLYVR